MNQDEGGGRAAAPGSEAEGGDRAPKAQNGGTESPGDASASAEERLEKEKRESRKSAVRTRVTYLAAGFLFLVGASVVGYLLATGKVSEAKDIFLTILPVASAVVTYWFATRRDGAVDPETMVKLMSAARQQP